MKRGLLILLVLTMFFSMGLIAFGEEEPNPIQVTNGTTGKTEKVYSVNLVMEGEPVRTDVPALLYTINWKSRTLVPIGFIVESLGAQIEWNQEKKEATIVTDEKTIVLKIDSATASVNGKDVLLPNEIPAKLLGYKGNYRTMVPLKFVAEQLGIEVGWIQESTTVTMNLPQYVVPSEFITAITYDDTKTPQILIKATGAVDVKTTYLEGSKYGSYDRLVLDMPNTVLNIEDSSIEEIDGVIKKTVNKDGIMTIRGSLFEPAPKNTSRIVVDLAMRKGYHVSYDKEKKAVKVEFLNSVNNIKTEKRNLVDAVVIEAEEMPAYNRMDLGGKVVVDVLNASLKFNKSEVPISQVGIKRIRVAQFDPDQNYEKDDRIVRVVLDLDSMHKPEDVFIEQVGRDIVIYTSQRPVETMDYEKENEGQSFLKLSLKNESSYDVDKMFNDNVLLVTIPKDEIDLEEALLEIDDKMIQVIKVEEQEDDYLLIITMKENTEYAVESKATTDEVKIRFTNTTKPFLGKKLIVIDAGHGGKDPGTKSKNPLQYEKNLALDTAKRLEKLLQEAGYATHMTRNDDTYIGLYDRSGAANALNADLFISVHYNWNPDPGISGVQMVYVDYDPRNNKALAQIMQEELAKELNAAERGLLHKPRTVVVRETQMPAVLCEIAFLSNDQDAQKASNPEYRQKAAQGILNGITRYINEVLDK
ncbi:N-acetylmuramoyl-L-alanine amidase [Clostridiaceae bacterium 35-E11]